MRTGGNILSKIILLWSFTLPAQCFAIISNRYQQTVTKLSMAMFVKCWFPGFKVCAGKNYYSFGSNVFPIEITFCDILRKAFIHINMPQETLPCTINKDFDVAWMENSLYALKIKYQRSNLVKKIL